MLRRIPAFPANWHFDSNLLSASLSNLVSKIEPARAHPCSVRIKNAVANIFKSVIPP